MQACMYANKAYASVEHEHIISNPRLASNLPEKTARACLSGPLGDLWIFDLALSTWAELPTALGSPPGPRAFHGFASLGGLLYVHGGQVEWCSRIGTLFVCRGGWALARLFVHWFKSIIILSRGWQSPAPGGGGRRQHHPAGRWLGQGGGVIGAPGAAPEGKEAAARGQARTALGRRAAAASYSAICSEWRMYGICTYSQLVYSIASPRLYPPNYTDILEQAHTYTLTYPYPADHRPLTPTPPSNRTHR